jgi:hypothetical protein
MEEDGLCRCLRERNDLWERLRALLRISRFSYRRQMSLVHRFREVLL